MVPNSSYEVLVNREDGRVNWEPVSVMRHDDTIYIAKYTRDNNLLDKPGWNHLHHYFKNTNNKNRLFKAAKL